MSGDCYCSRVLSYGAVGWSAVCDCGISDHNHLLFVIFGFDGGQNSPLMYVALLEGALGVKT